MFSFCFRIQRHVGTRLLINLHLLCLNSKCAFSLGGTFIGNWRQKISHKAVTFIWPHSFVKTRNSYWMPDHFFLISTCYVMHFKAKSSNMLQKNLNDCQTCISVNVFCVYFRWRYYEKIGCNKISLSAPLKFWLFINRL